MIIWVMTALRSEVMTQASYEEEKKKQKKEDYLVSQFKTKRVQDLQTGLAPLL